jgi:hypothetical protein
MWPNYPVDLLARVPAQWQLPRPTLIVVEILR